MALNWIFPELTISCLQGIKLRMCSYKPFIVVSWMNSFYRLSIWKFILLVVLIACHQSHCMWLKFQHVLIGPWYHWILFCQDLKNEWMNFLKDLLKDTIILNIMSYFHNIKSYDQCSINMAVFCFPQSSHDPYQLSMQFKYEQDMSTLLMIMSL